MELVDIGEIIENCKKRKGQKDCRTCPDKDDFENCDYWKSCKPLLKRK